MIKVTTDCEKCIHNKMCKYRNNVKRDAEKLRKTRYGDGPNDDYDWNTMSDANHVTIAFSCKDFRSEVNYR